jgi:hypothetical protein
MPYDSNGNASLVPGYLAVEGQTILPSQHNPPLEDIAAMLSQVVLRSGVAPMSGHQNYNGFRATNLGTATNPGDAVTLAQLQELVGDPWALQPIGKFIEYDAGEGLAPPPKNKSYRYVLLTAGQTGSGAYNEGILTSETVTGTDPTISATAVVSLVGSPLNGKTIRLINTERRFLRPGTGGTLEDSQNLAHSHSITDPGHAHTLQPNIPLPVADTDRGNPGASSLFSLDAFQATAPTNNATTGISINSNGGNEARPRALGVVYYRRIL